MQSDAHTVRANVVSAAGSPFTRFGRGTSTHVLYFSFTTLTTLGYGDIVPVSPIARALTSTEAITGPIYLAVLVVRLVGLNIAESMGQRQS
jgi:voltage-gated potassium channel Kch